MSTAHLSREEQLSQGHPALSPAAWEPTQSVLGTHYKRHPLAAGHMCQTTPHPTDISVCAPGACQSPPSTPRGGHTLKLQGWTLPPACSPALLPLSAPGGAEQNRNVSHSAWCRARLQIRIKTPQAASWNALSAGQRSSQMFIKEKTISHGCCSMTPWLQYWSNHLKTDLLTSGFLPNLGTNQWAYFHTCLLYIFNKHFEMTWDIDDNIGELLKDKLGCTPQIAVRQRRWLWDPQGFLVMKLEAKSVGGRCAYDHGGCRAGLWRRLSSHTDSVPKTLKALALVTSLILPPGIGAGIWKGRFSQAKKFPPNIIPTEHSRPPGCVSSGAIRGRQALLASRAVAVPELVSHGQWAYLIPMCSVTQSCPTLCDPIDRNLPGSSIQGILQVRILQWVAISSPRYLPIPGIKPRSPTSHALTDGFCTAEPPGKPLVLIVQKPISSQQECFINILKNSQEPFLVDRLLHPLYKNFSSFQWKRASFTPLCSLSIYPPWWATSHWAALRVQPGHWPLV